MKAETNGNAGENTILITDRKMLELHGVLRVEDFDNEQVNLETTQGRLVVRGRNLHVAQLLLESEELSLEGEIDSLSFEETPGKKRSRLLARLTK
ncbi:MAG TPA: sporulation protein YabP [Candidatus Avidehalobacter gallistercoris]|uniref:Sporulation protein YabP n=1 Tax=Candidatus Avidehalobacter gallistercoris TaxID=2840694 RepID=A0A9D1HM76_9FIRM|nr:sporulation protein YabP [Candidatus Avidehalobacter gallistercoris]